MPLFCAVLAAGLHVPHALAVTPQVGDTVRVKSDVTAETGEATRKLNRGDDVFQDEILVTSKSASAEIELLDKTKLAVGASARIVLDKFIYDANAAPGSISINLAKGAFRFITGASPKAAYEIKTPTASMGVRGTIFDVYVADDGETAVLLHEGGVDVCPTPTTCQRHDKVGQFMHVGVDRVLTTSPRWDSKMGKGVAVGRAFPFVGKKLQIDPVCRTNHAALLRGKATGVIKSRIEDLNRALEKPHRPF